jgi:hypothetical protein
MTSDCPLKATNCMPHQGFRILDQPLNETLYRAWAFGQPGAAEKLKNDLKVRHLMASDGR